MTMSGCLAIVLMLKYSLQTCLNSNDGSVHHSLHQESSERCITCVWLAGFGVLQFSRNFFITGFIAGISNEVSKVSSLWEVSFQISPTGLLKCRPSRHSLPNWLFSPICIAPAFPEVLADNGQRTIRGGACG